MDAVLGDTLTLRGLAWLLAAGLPLLPAVGCLTRLRSKTILLAPWTALPALLLALWPLPSARYPWLLLGATMGLEDETGRVFLLFTAFLWICSGVYARSYLARDELQHRFFAFFLLTASGNLGLILARDMIAFYFCFVLMTFAAYGLIVHGGSLAARRAGLVYVVMALIGEVALITALLIIGITGYGNLLEPAFVVAVAEGRNLIIVLLLMGFGVKAGAVPLHLWLPLAHPVAPTPASAVLSGVLIKAGLLGWLRFLPMGEAAFPHWGGLCMTAGLAAALFGVLMGLTQDDPKTVLAYSSISQMGVMITALGIGLTVPAAWPLTLAALLFYALQHALAKGALFLGVGMTGAAVGGAVQRLTFYACILLPALSLAGAPLTSGALAKAALKGAAYLTPDPWSSRLDGLLALSAIGTALLMAHFMIILRHRCSKDLVAHRPGGGQWASWLLLLAAVASATWLLPAGELEAVRAELSAITRVWEGLWPVLLGAVLGWIVWRLVHRKGARTSPLIPAGDLLVIIVWLLNKPVRLFRAGMALEDSRLNYRETLEKLKNQELSALLSAVTAGEGWLVRWRLAGIVFLLLTTGLLLLLAMA